MASNSPPEGVGQAQEPPEQGGIVGDGAQIGVARPDRFIVDSLIPVSQLAPLMEAQMGRLKAQIESDFDKRLAKLDDLPTKWQSVATNVGTIVVGLGLFFAIAAYFDGRQAAAIEQSSSISSTLTRIDERLTGLEREADNEEPEPTGGGQRR